MDLNTEFWRTCSACKKAIKYSTKYYECSVSTCTGKRTGYVFCSVSCWETHLPGARHRDAGAVEKHSPSFEAWKKELEVNPPTHSEVQNLTSTAPRRIIVNSSHAANSLGNHHQNLQASSMSQEVLVVVSKMKQYIKDRADMNTSGDVADILSDLIRKECDKAIETARDDGRKTVMARDFK